MGTLTPALIRQLLEELPSRAQEAGMLQFRFTTRTADLPRISTPSSSPTGPSMTSPMRWHARMTYRPIGSMPERSPSSLPSG